MMKQVLFLTLLVCAAFAVPTEDKDVKAVEVAEDAPEGQVVAVTEAVAEAPVDTEVAAEAPASEEVALANGRFVSCPSGWFFHGTRCFLLVTSSKNWFDAEDHCNSLGAHLASATSLSEYSFLQQLTQFGGRSSAWLGGFYLQARWLWIDGQGMSYVNWHILRTPITYSCIQLHSTVPWSNYACAYSNAYICSKSPFTC